MSLKSENRPIAYAVAIVWAVLALAAVVDVAARKIGAKPVTLGEIVRCTVVSVLGSESGSP